MSKMNENQISGFSSFEIQTFLKLHREEHLSNVWMLV